MSTTRPPVYQLDNWITDLRTLVKARGLSVTAAAQQLGLSRATAYRLIGQARAGGDW